MTLVQSFLEESALRVPERVALVAAGRRHSYAEIEAWANRFASALRASGVSRGDRVAIFAENGVEVVVSIFAVLKLGAIFIPVNSLTKGDKLAYVLNDAEATALVTSLSLQDSWRPALASARSVKACFVAGLEDAEGEDKLASFESALQDASSGAVTSCTIDQDLASIIYTSGSTGDPKGVMLSHLNMVSAAKSVNGYLGMNGEDVILCALPLAFDYGLYQVLMGFLVGATVVLERSFAFPVKMLQVMASEGVTVFPGVPTMFAMIASLGSMSQFDLRRLRMITNTAAALPEQRIRELRARFPGATLFSMYGLTECKRVTYLPPDQLDVRATSVGRGMPNEEVWLVDEQGNRLPNGSTGELVIRGSNVMRGYWRKPEQTARRLRPGPLPGEMVLYSGDIFRSDDEGYLYFVARKDNIIKSRGEKVSPREVENVLCGIEGVLEAAVVGMPDPILGQAIKAFVVMKPGQVSSEREIIRRCHAKLEDFMVPKHVEFVDSLPTTDTGKVKLSALG